MKKILTLVIFGLAFLGCKKDHLDFQITYKASISPSGAGFSEMEYFDGNFKNFGGEEILGNTNDPWDTSFRYTGPPGEIFICGATSNDTNAIVTVSIYVNGSMVNTNSGKMGGYASWKSN